MVRRGFPSTQRHYRRFYYLFLLNCYMFRSYDHLQAEIYLLELTLLITDTLFLEYYLTSRIIIVIDLIDSWLLLIWLLLYKLNRMKPITVVVGPALMSCKSFF
jgi:hypothetical protein